MMMNTEIFEVETCDFDIPEEYFEELFPEYPERSSKRGKRQRVKAYRKNKFPVSLRKELSSNKKIDKQYEKEERSKKREKFFRKDVKTTLQDIEAERRETYETYYERPFYSYQEDDEYYPGDYPDQEEKRREEERYLAETYGDYDFCYPETEAMYDDIF